MDKFSYKVFQFVTRKKLIEAGDKVVISISGGIDSMSLFRLFHTFSESINLSIHLVHFHHGLRCESDEEEAFIRTLADQKNTPLTVIRTDHFAGQKGMQNQAREWRYENLLRTMNEVGGNKIALGHHLNDLLETQLWRMMRGASLYSLNPMREKSLPYIRPLLRTKKEELKQYLLAIGQEWREDQSNQSNDYTRNMIRNRLVPVMMECSGGKLEEKFLALSDDAELLRLDFESIVSKESYETDTVPYQSINLLSPLMAIELIHRFLLYHGQDEINRDNLKRIHDLVKSNKGNWKIALKYGVTIMGKHKVLSIFRN